MVDILLINAITSKTRPAYIPNGILWVASVLRDNGYNVKVWDRNVDDTPIDEYIKKINPKIIGLSVLSGAVILDAIEISKVCKKINNDIKVVWGGIHPTLCPEKVLKEDYVDYIVMGEGEYPMLELADHIFHKKQALCNIKNIGYKKRGRIKLNPLRDFIDLDNLPFPAFDLIDIEKYLLMRPYASRVVCLMTSRGCPFKCTFCYNRKVNKSTWRGMSIDRLMELVKFMIKKYNINGFLFHDDNFAANQTRFKEFCNRLIKEKIKIKWEYFSRVNYANEESLKLVKKAGGCVIAYGLESGSERILKLINKGQTVSQVRNAIKLCKKIGISTSVGSIIGYPFETDKDLQQTLDLFKELKPTHIFTTIFNPYPGSELYDYVIDKGIFKEPDTLEEQGKTYLFGNIDLNMSKISTDKLVKIIDKYYWYNAINEGLDYLRFFRFKALLECLFIFIKRTLERRKINWE